MGLFKSIRDLRNVTKQARKIHADHLAQQGYKPGMAGQLQQMGDLLSNATDQLADLTDSDGDRARILFEGLDGVGVIVGMGTPARGASLYSLDLDLEVHVAGRPPYRVAGAYIVPAAAQLGQGVTIPIRVDRTDPAKIAIDWNRAGTAPAKGVVRPAEGAGGFMPPPPAPAGSNAIDSVALIERLAKLKESGALSEAEFQQQKARILGG
ncbi:MAG: SHOCT domain-containing protein [Ilumatobacteraceae bacterium]